MIKKTKWIFIPLLTILVLFVLAEILNPPDRPEGKAPASGTLGSIHIARWLGLVKTNKDPLIVKKKLGVKTSSALIYPDEKGFITIQMGKSQCLELRFFPAQSSNRELLVEGKLPLGSSLDPERGIFRWKPPASHAGHYRLIFAVREPDGVLYRQEVAVHFLPGVQELSLTDRYDR